MNFFKSILSDDADPPKPDNPHESDPNSPINSPTEDLNSNDDVHDGNVGGWSFGGLMKTIAAQSESVIETYRRDLKEFGSGLQKESEVIREAASKAVKDLPASIEAGTAAASGVLDGVLKSTAEIISKETQAFGSDGEGETLETNRNSGRYSWFDSQLSGIQSDLSTFCEEPEDVEEYSKWKSRFEIDEYRKRGEIDGLIGENGSLEGVYKRVVPSEIDDETFWCRYFYRVEKIMLQEKVRANLVKRAISVDDDEDELSWDVDDDEFEDGNGNVKDKGVSEGSSSLVEKGEILNSELVESSEKSSGDVVLDEKEVKSDEKVKTEEIVEKKQNENAGVEKKDESREESDVSVVSSDEKVKFEEGVEKKNDEKVTGVEEKGESRSVSNELKTEEEDMGWDEIEDIGSGDEKKMSATNSGGSPNRAELRKRLSAAEDDEDLSWDIEDDDDEPVKT